MPGVDCQEEQHKTNFLVCRWSWKSMCSVPHLWFSHVDGSWWNFVGFQIGTCDLSACLHRYGWRSVGAVPAPAFIQTFLHSKLSCTVYNPNGGLWGWSPHHKGHISYPTLGAAPIHRALTRHKAATLSPPLWGGHGAGVWRVCGWVGRWLHVLVRMWAHWYPPASLTVRRQTR